MPPSNQPSSGVWISKEEYERLRQAEEAGAAASGTPALAGAAGSVQPNWVPVGTSQRNTAFQIAAGGLIAILVFVGLTVPGSMNLVGLGLGALLVVMVGVSMHDAAKARREQAKTGVKSKGRRGLKILIIIAGLVLLSPVILYAGLIGLLLIVCGTGGCQGS